MEKVLIGKIVNAVGLKGELRVYNYSDSVDIYINTKTIYVDDRPLKIQNLRTQKNMLVLKLEGIDDRDAAEKAKGSELFVTEKDLPKLPKGQHYVRDLIGMDIVQDDDDREEHLGVIADVIQNTAQDILDIKTDAGKQLLIPNVPEFVLEINEKKRVITVNLIEGMLEL